MPNVPINDIKVYRKDLVIATQGRGMYILDNLSALQQITPQTSAQKLMAFKPRDGYRTSTGAAYLGPQLDYYLADAARDTITIEILDAKGTVVNTYKSDAPVGGRGGRGGRGGGGGDPAAGGDAAGGDAEAGGGGGGFGGFGGRGAEAALMNQVTKQAGFNRFTWGLQHKNGLSSPPGSYQARISLAGTTQTVLFTVLIDPRVAADGITAADLRAQFEHNSRVRELVTDANTLVAQARAAENRLKSATGASADTLAKVKAVETKLLTAPVRYGKPGLQAHITYLASMTSRVDQKVGRDAIERYATLRKELDAAKAELDKALGPIKQ